MEDVRYYNYAVDEFRSMEFPGLKDVTYVDHAGATLYSRSQLNAVHGDLSTHLYGNPHSGSPASKLTADTVDNVRYRILKFFNTTPDHYTVIFTSGCTGALKLLGESFSFSKPPPSPEDDRKGSERELDAPAKDPSETGQQQEEAAGQGPLPPSRPPPLPSQKRSSGQTATAPTSLATTPGAESPDPQIDPQQRLQAGSRTSTAAAAAAAAATERPVPAFVPLVGHLSYFNPNDEGWRGAQRMWKKPRAGRFYYLQDNHTSVQGMRELVADRCKGAVCLTEDEVTQGLSWESLVVGGHPCLDDCGGWDDDAGENDDGRYCGNEGGGGCVGDWSGNSLFIFPGQSNFSGRKYPLHWIPEAQAGSLGFQAQRVGARWFVALDAASLASTSPLDLTAVQPDFVTLSFYKIFGFPTGLGALLVRNKSSWVLERNYYGGGTVAASIARERFCALKAGLADRFEDGTLPYLDIVAVRHGLNTLHELGGSIERISSHTFLIAQYFAQNLTRLTHFNGAPLAEVYANGSFENRRTQGAIVNFNLKRANGDYIGFAEVDKLAQLHDIQLRTGCFCNIGACQAFLGMASSTVKDNLRAGHVCGDDVDLVNGRPTGSVRISFGYMSSLSDATACLRFVVRCFLQGDSSTPAADDDDLLAPSLLPSPAAASTPTTAAREDARVFTTPEWFKPPATTSAQPKKRAQDSDLSEFATVREISASPGRSKAQVKSSDSYASSQQTAFGSCGDSVLEVSPLSDRSKPEQDSSGLKDASSQQPALGQGDRVVQGGEEEEEEGQAEGNREEEEEFKCSEKRRKLTDIFVYPVKSCGAFRVTQWELRDRGLLYDRTWMVVSESGVVLSQKREPRLCLLLPVIHLVTGTLELTFPGVTSCSVPLEVDVTDSAGDDVNICTNKICNDRVTTADCGDKVAGWLSDTLGRPGLRLFRQLDQDTRQSRRHDLTQDATATTAGEEGRQSQLSLANECQFLVLSRESVRSLQKKLSETLEDRQADTKQHSTHGGQQILDEEDLVARFRANLVIDGGLPFDEDRWTSMACRQVSFIGQGQCSRCGMICLNQKTGEKTREPLRTLAAWRQGKVYFGVYMRLQCEEARPVLKVGSEVTVA